MRLLSRLLLAALATAVLAALALFGLYHVPDPGADAPRVVVAVDRTLWNRLGLNRLTYVRALRRAGLSTDLVGFTGSGELEVARLEGIAGIVLTGGGDVAAGRYGGDASLTLNVKPARDAFETALLRYAEAEGLPVLGLCRGAQLINVERGGTLVSDLSDIRVHTSNRGTLLPRKAVRIEPRSTLAGLIGNEASRVNSLHHQAVARCGNGLVVSARDRDDIVQGIESTDGPWRLGVQWHPEYMPQRRDQRRLFRGFVEVCGG